jgi:Glycosyltransferase family 87
MSATAARATAAPARELVRRARWAGGIAAVLALVASGTVVALAGTVPRFAHGIPGAEWTAGPLGADRLHLTSAQLYLLIGAMAVTYLAVLALRPAARWVMAAIVALHVVFLLAAPLFSTDVYSYIDYARLGALHGLDPYTAIPAAVPHDPVFPFIHWRTTPSAYGPLFTLGSYPLANVSPGAALVGFKLAAALSSLGCVALIWWIAGRLGRPRTQAIAMYGLNPLLLVWTVGGAHNDLTMLLAMLGGIALVLGRRELTGGATLVAAVAVKASAGLAIPFVVLGAQRRLRTAAGVAIGAAVVLAISFVAFPDGAAGMVRVLSHERHLVSSDSVPLDVAFLFGLLDVTAPVRTAFELGFVAVVLAGLVHVWRRRAFIAATGWAFLALVVASTWLLGWYTIWSLPFAALARDRRLFAATLAVQAYFVANHLPIR